MLGRGSLNTVHKTIGKKRDQKMVQPGTKVVKKKHAVRKI